jgi:multicomponent Na+:H+ antiporter subunit F
VDAAFDVITGLALVVQIAAAVVCVARIATSQTLQDRIVALDLLLVVVVGGVAIVSARTGQIAYLDVLIVGALVVFIGSILAARLLDADARPERRP